MGRLIKKSRLNKGITSGIVARCLCENNKQHKKITTECWRINCAVFIIGEKEFVVALVIGPTCR